jgi:hypothetical protein
LLCRAEVVQGAKFGAGQVQGDFHRRRRLSRGVRGSS